MLPTYTTDEYVSKRHKKARVSLALTSPTLTSQVENNKSVSI